MVYTEEKTVFAHEITYARHHKLCVEYAKDKNSYLYKPFNPKLSLVQQKAKPEINFHQIFV